MKKTLFIIVSALVIIFSTVPTQAEEITTQNTDFLRLDSSSVVDGDESVSTLPIIQLNFSKNMDDITVLGSNKNAFYLLDESGNPLQIKVVFPDTQMQNYLKKQAFIIPKDPLLPGKNYSLIIDKGLTSKDGLKLQKDIKIVFIANNSKNITSTNENEDFKILKDNILEYDGNLKYDKSFSTENEMTKTKESTKSTSSKFIAYVAASSILIIIILSVVITITKNKKKH